MIEKKDEMQEQLDKRDMILRYFKQVDYNLKPSKEIYTRIKGKIIALSGINAKTEWSYADLCKQAGLDLKEGRELISSLFNKELIHMIKRYDAVLLNQEVEAFYIDKQYTVGMNIPIPDMAMITHEQALDYIVGVIGMNIILRSINNVDEKIIMDGINKITIINQADKDTLMSSARYRNKAMAFRQLFDINKKLVAHGMNCDLTKDLLVHCIENVKKVDLLQNLLCDAAKKNTNINQKFYAGSCEVNDVKYYLFPI
jgi:hypothetical protein